MARRSVHRSGGNAGPGSGQLLEHTMFAGTRPPHPDGLGSRDQQRFDLTDHGDSSLDRAGTNGQQHTDLFDEAVTGLGPGQRLRLSQGLLRGGVGVDWIGLPTSPLRPPGSDDLADVHLLRPQVSSKPGTIGTVALDAAKSDVSERFEVGQEPLVASSSSEDLSITEGTAAPLGDSWGVRPRGSRPGS